MIENMKKIDIEDIKKISLEVLCQLRDVCDQNGLSYSLTGGTLIGAVRHQGFIPWDDDIDIMMPRADYDRLISLAKTKEFEFRLLSNELCGTAYGYPFAKACHKATILTERNVHETNIPLGVYVDIFPVDGMGNRFWTAKFRCMLFQFLHGLKITSNWSGFQRSKLRKWYYEPARYSCYLISKLFSRKIIDRSIDHFVRAKDMEKSRYAGRMVGDFGSKEVMPKELFDSKVKLVFEGEKFDAIADYHMFLTRLYGDYMQLPPEEKRVSHHEFDAYWV